MSSRLQLAIDKQVEDQIHRNRNGWKSHCAGGANRGHKEFVLALAAIFLRDAATKELTAEAGKTVFVDFTADWCQTCKTKLNGVAINTRAVSELVHDFGIVPLKADWTEESDEIKDMLNLLGRNSIPVYAVFPAERPNEPIVFSDLVTKGQVLDKLRRGRTVEECPREERVAATALGLQGDVPKVPGRMLTPALKYSASLARCSSGHGWEV